MDDVARGCMAWDDTPSCELSSAWDMRFNSEEEREIWEDAGDYGCVGLRAALFNGYPISAKMAPRTSHA
jgi:hypothetical protein